MRVFIKLPRVTLVTGTWAIGVMPLKVLLAVPMDMACVVPVPVCLVVLRGCPIVRRSFGEIPESLAVKPLTAVQTELMMCRVRQCVITERLLVRMVYVKIFTRVAQMEVQPLGQLLEPQPEP